MYVCLCFSVTDEEIHDAVDQGAQTVEQLADHCGAGTGCGGCRGMAQELIDKRLAESRSYAA